MSSADAVLESDLLLKVSSFEASSRKVQHFAWGAAAVGLLPGPYLDFAGVFGVQIWLLKRLANGYGVPFQADLAKEVVGSLLGALVPTELGHGVVGLAIRSIPVVGPFVGMTLAPGFNYLSTLAIGRAFEKHFATGGTFLDFDLDKLKGQVVNEYNELKAKWRRKRSGVSVVLEQNDRLKQEMASLKESLAKYEEQMAALRAEMKQSQKAPAPAKAT